MDERRGDWIQTYTQCQFWPLDPRPEDVCIEDIAHALSNQCRYSGHVESYFSVAQHSVLVSRCLPEGEALWGLLHDASEAYLVDLPRPLKNFSELGDAYKKIEKRLMEVICLRFGLPQEEPPLVKHFDNVLLATEKRDLMKRSPQPWSITEAPLTTLRIVPLEPRLAERMFLRRFHELTD
jgi:uncharacterized protein